MLGLLLTGDATSFEEAIHKLQALRATEAATEAATEVQVLTLLVLLTLLFFAAAFAAVFLKTAESSMYATAATRAPSPLELLSKLFY